MVSKSIDSLIMPTQQSSCPLLSDRESVERRNSFRKIFTAPEFQYLLQEPIDVMPIMRRLKGNIEHIKLVYDALDKANWQDPIVRGYDGYHLRVLKMEILKEKALLEATDRNVEKKDVEIQQFPESIRVKGNRFQDILGHNEELRAILFADPDHLPQHLDEVKYTLLKQSDGKRLLQVAEDVVRKFMTANPEFREITCRQLLPILIGAQYPETMQLPEKEEDFGKFPDCSYALDELGAVAEDLKKDGYRKAIVFLQHLRFLTYEKPVHDPVIKKFTTEIAKKFPGYASKDDPPPDQTLLGKEFDDVYLNCVDAHVGGQRFFLGGCPQGTAAQEALFAEIIENKVPVMVSLHTPNEFKDADNTFWKKACRSRNGWDIKNTGERSVKDGSSQLFDSTLVSTKEQETFTFSHLYFPWKDREGVSSTVLFDQLVDIVHERSHGNQTVYINCGLGGYGRCCTLAAVLFLRRQIDQMGVERVNVKETIYAFRRAQPQAVWHPVELVTIFDYLHRYVERLKNCKKYTQ